MWERQFGKVFPWVYLIFMVSIGKYSIRGDIRESYCMSAYRHPKNTCLLAFD